jgi:ubiquinone/menaquinone biosynthesis C-methylase UbiE
METNVNKIEKAGSMGLAGEPVSLLSQLPEKISRILLNGFLNGKSLCPTKKKLIVDYFRDNSRISRELIKDPGTFKMLEIIYTKEGVCGVVDEYMSGSISGQALRNRLSVVILEVDKIIDAKEKKQKLEILNLGSGPGRDTMEIISSNENTSVCCVDTNTEALAKARELIEERGVGEKISLLQKSLMFFPYNNYADIILMIGILCGLDYRNSVIVLRKAKRYLKKNAKLIVSNISKTAKDEDPFMAYLLDAVIGWKLVYKTEEEFTDIIQMAGYKVERFFYDERKFHLVAVCSVPLQ